MTLAGIPRFTLGNGKSSAAELEREDAMQVALTAGNSHTPTQPVLRDSEPSIDRDPVAKILALLDAAADLRLSVNSIMLHETTTPGVEYALRLWASARQLEIVESRDLIKGSAGMSDWWSTSLAVGSVCVFRRHEFVTPTITTDRDHGDEA